MVTKQEIIKFLNENKEFLKVNFHITKIGLFGSFAKDEEKEQSDIDILIEFEKDTQNIFELKNQLRNYIRENLKRDVDICREKYLKPYAKEVILKDTIYV